MRGEAEDGLAPAKLRWALAAITLAIGMATLDLAIANTALPTIAVDLRTSPAASVWVINAYQLAVVASVLPITALGEIVGHRRVYIAGLVLFTLASAACACSWSLPTLVAARILQGLGASAVTGVNAAILRAIYPESRLGRGLGYNALVVAVCFAIGPTVASVILAVGPWPMLFAVNVPIGVAAVLIARRTIPHTPRRGHRFDWQAALLNAALFGLLILALAQAAQRSGAAYVAGELAVVLACLFLLLRRQAGHPAPMLPVDLFRRRPFALSAATGLGAFTAQGLAFVSLPFYFEATLHHSQVDTGFLMTPWPVVVALIGPVAGRLVDRYPAGILGGAGLAVLGAGMAALALMPPAPAPLDIGWRMALCGAGFGFFQSPNLKALMTGAPRERSGAASGVVSLTRLLGQTLGAALSAFCLGIGGETGAMAALWLGAAFALAGAVASVLRLVG